MRLTKISKVGECEIHVTSSDKQHDLQAIIDENRKKCTNSHQIDVNLSHCQVYVQINITDSIQIGRQKWKIFS